MAIDNIRAYSHLTDEDIAEIGRRLDAIKAEIEADLGEDDVRYIKGLIRFQRSLEIAGRATLLFSHKKPLWWAGSGMLAVSKILENMEIGHNVIHGQWDWMNDPEIHSTTWEWDMTCPSSQWMHSHNYVHHKYTNIIGMDNDVGYGILRVTRDRKWTPQHAFQPLTNVVLASLFQWAIAFYDVELGRYFAGKQGWDETKVRFWEAVHKSKRQVIKDYVLFPALSGPNYVHTVTANAFANWIRSVWAYLVIFCGHFPDETETFTKEQYATEDHNEWYLRQMLGSANFKGGKLLTILSGNLNYQIEHHLFPDMPSNRLADVGKRVEDIAREFELPYNTDSFPMQLIKVQKTLLKLTLPNKYLAADPDNAPEVRSNAAFTKYPEVEEKLHVGAAADGVRKGLRTGLRMLEKLRPTVVEGIRGLTGRSPYHTPVEKTRS
ncbi:fatty acid desaturase [Corynebacterium sp. CCM 8835]|uniref:Fatty acid desaturase n=1 Tax=Corynebacterium antarcticum TaxID=2800405 RepID=A0A9Q4CF50_9CORY|nr:MULTISPECIES: fatty acid desaturase [Corynebacterium]MBV7292520.1 fatty acid desaturase [Corynebacterium sp. TAE3-ERU16]MCK7642164.1 fatty acid desaturase [Corynebacterium antarcticum]MCK7661153.1 fatty acid desaturase [Corynebacterium antarcticum]MCL0245901.1 fatty acid desaturase [Corynebacterium antarcticum]MCX7491642.1 fatty acid desaturase [Corynebacterium antarcticum]